MASQRVSSFFGKCFEKYFEELLSSYLRADEYEKIPECIADTEHYPECISTYSRQCGGYPSGQNQYQHGLQV